MKQVTIGTMSIFVGVLAVMQPFTVFAEDASTTLARPANFCVAIENITAEKLDQFEIIMNRQLERREAQDDHMASVREKVDAKRVEIMDKFGMRRGAIVSKFETRNGTAADLDPETYRAMQEVMDSHMQELSSIMIDFRTNQDARVALTRTQMDELISQKKEDVEAALAQAQVDCKAGKDPKEVQESFKDKLKVIHQSFVESRSNIVGDSKEEHRLNVTAKNEARAVINGDFSQRIRSIWNSFVSLFKARVSE